MLRSFANYSCCQHMIIAAMILPWHVTLQCLLSSLPSTRPVPIPSWLSIRAEAQVHVHVRMRVQVQVQHHIGSLAWPSCLTG